jgi:hypothetical protein
MLMLMCPLLWSMLFVIHYRLVEDLPLIFGDPRGRCPLG